MSTGLGLGLGIGHTSFVQAGGIYVPADTDGLLACWSAEDGAGQTLADTSGNGNDGQLGSDPGSDTNDPTWVTSPDCLDYDGTDDYCELDSGGVGSFSDLGTLTFVIAMNATNPGDRNAFMFGRQQNASSTTMYRLGVQGWAGFHRFYYSWWDGGGTGRSIFTTHGDVTYGSWQTCGVSHDITTPKAQVYSNGSPVGTPNTTNAGRTSFNGPLILGGEWTSTTIQNPHVDKIGVVLLYNAAKSDAEMAAIHSDIRANFPDYGLPA